jgi:hypothetical protein
MEQTILEASPAAAPLPALGGLEPLAPGVAAAVGQVASATGLGHSVHHSSTCHRVYEGRLLASCTHNRAHVSGRTVSLLPVNTTEHMSAAEQSPCFLHTQQST